MCVFLLRWPPLAHGSWMMAEEWKVPQQVDLRHKKVTITRVCLRWVKISTKSIVLDGLLGERPSGTEPGRRVKRFDIFTCNEICVHIIVCCYAVFFSSSCSRSSAAPEIVVVCPCLDTLGGDRLLIRW